MIQKHHLKSRRIADPPARMKVVCSWCGKTIRGGPDETVSHGICYECKKWFEAEYRESRKRREEPYHDGRCQGPYDFVGDQIMASFALFLVIFLIIMAFEGLHRLTGGKVPELIEWHPKKAPSYEESWEQEDLQNLAPFFLLPSFLTAGLSLSQIGLFHRLNGLSKQSGKINPKCLADPQKGINRRQSFPFFNPADHCVAQAGQGCYLVHGQPLIETLFLKRLNQLCNNCFALRGIQHPLLLSEETSEGGSDYRRNTNSPVSREKTLVDPPFFDNLKTWLSNSRKYWL